MPRRKKTDRARLSRWGTAGVASQLDALYQAVAARGYALTAELVLVDEGYSGARLDRPGLERLRDVAAEGTVTAILVYGPGSTGSPLCLSGRHH